MSKLVIWEALVIPIRTLFTSFLCLFFHLFLFLFISLFIFINELARLGLKTQEHNEIVSLWSVIFFSLVYLPVTWSHCFLSCNFTFKTVYCIKLLVLNIPFALMCSWPRPLGAWLMQQQTPIPLHRYRSANNNHSFKLMKSLLNKKMCCDEGGVEASSIFSWWKCRYTRHCALGKGEASVTLWEILLGMSVSEC